MGVGSDKLKKKQPVSHQHLKSVCSRVIPDYTLLTNLEETGQDTANQLQGDNY